MRTKRAASLALSAILTLTGMQTGGCMTAFAETVDATTESVTAEFTEAITDGLEVRASDGNTATVTAGDVSNSDGMDGIHTESIGSGSSIDVTVNGNVTGEDDGIEAIAAGDASVAVTVNGDIQSNYGIYTHNNTDEGEADYVAGHGTVDVNVTGNIDTYNNSIYAFGYNDSTVNIAVTGNITSQDGEAICVDSSNNSVVTVDVTGNVTGYYDGIHTETYGGSATVNVTGDVSGDDDGIYVQAPYSDTSSVTVKGNVEAKRSNEFENTDGININFGNGTVTVSVKDKDDPDNSDISGNVSSEQWGLYVHKYDVDTADTDTDTEAGTGTDTAASSGSADVLIEGVLHGDTASVLVTEKVTAENLKLTVWKVDPNQDGKIVETEIVSKDRPPEEEGVDVAGPAGAAGTVDDGTLEKNRAAIEQSIQYIIKVEQPKEGAALKATGKGGTALATSHGFDVANEGDEVYLKVDLQKGFKLTGAFNGLGDKVALVKDTAGNYYVAVPKGGGVYLTAEIEKIKDEEKKDDGKKDDGKKDDGKKDDGKKDEQKNSDSSSDSSDDSSVWTSGWVRETAGWRYRNTDGSYLRKTFRLLPWDGQNYWYYFDDNGYMHLGWLLYGGKWYYLETQPGKNQGHMFANAATPDGYQVGADGAWVE